MSNLMRCSWKLVEPSKFVMGQSAARCGAIADVVVLRPNRKTDLFLCEEHINEFILHWGLHNKVEILCQETQDPWNKMNGLDWDEIGPALCRHGRPECECGGNEPHCVDPGCKKCLPDEPRTWRHK
jgi:hypothetical protein